MKLYTEEQVKSAFKVGMRENYIDEQNVQDFADIVIKYLKPIELPSDEEIKHCIGSVNYTEYDNGFIQGIKWMKEQILNQK